MRAKPATTFRKRIYAYVIDQFLLSIAIGYPLSLATGGNVFDSMYLTGALTMVFSFIYWALMDFTFGQSLGKQAVHIRTSGMTKLKLSLGPALVRSVSKVFLALLFIDCLPLILGRDFRFSDRIAGTRVIDWKE